MNIRYFEKRPGAWHLDFKIDGRRMRPFGGTTRATAETQAPRLIAEALQATAVPSVPPQGNLPAKHAGPTLREAFKLGLKTREQWIDSRDKKTLEVTFKSILATAGAGLTDDTPLATMDRDRVRALRSLWLVEPGKRAGTTLSRSTINHRLSMLTVLLEVADLPPHGVKHLSVKGTGRTRRITDAEVASILAWCVEHKHRRGAMGMHDAVLLALDCGAREGELLGLAWANVRGATLTFHDTKNGESRTVPIDQRSEALLEARRALPAPFADVEQRQLINLWSDMRKALGLATDEEFVFHALRHEAVSRLLDAGANSFTVQAIAGHASIATTQKYAHASMEAMRRASAARVAVAA